MAAVVVVVAGLKLQETKCSHGNFEVLPSGASDGLRGWDEVRFRSSFEIELKSLILAQIERWRHALHMQVERQRGGNPGGERRTGE